MTEKKIVYAGLGILTLGVIWLAYRHNKMVATISTPALAESGPVPVINGQPFVPQLQWGGNNPISTPTSFNINVNSAGAGILANKYMPLFGFVGQAAYGLG